MYNVEEIRKDFPVLNMLVNGKPNTFLDSGASAQKPQVVIDRMVDIIPGNIPTFTAVLTCCRSRLRSSMKKPGRRLPDF